MSPTFSGECAVLALLAVILGFALLGAIAALSIHVRRSVLGKQLLDACAGDYETAVKAIANVRAENEYMSDLIALGIGALFIDENGKRTRVPPQDISKDILRDGMGGYIP